MEADRISPRTLCLSLGAVFAAETAGALLLSSVPSPLAALVPTRILEIVVLLLLLNHEGGVERTLGLGRRGICRELGRGFLWSAGFGLLVLAGFLAIRMTGGNPLDRITETLPWGLSERLLFLFAGVILAPVAEEIFFRGVLYGFLRRWGFVPALLLSTALFTFLHPTGQGVPVTQIVGGLLFAAAYEAEGSLAVPVVIHCLGNGAIFFLSWVR